VDVFPLELPTAIGALQIVDIGFATKQSVASSLSAGKDWFLSSVTVLDLDTRAKAVFFADAWINKAKPRLQLTATGGAVAAPIRVRARARFLAAAASQPHPRACERLLCLSMGGGGVL